MAPRKRPVRAHPVKTTMWEAIGPAPSLNVKSPTEQDRKRHQLALLGHVKKITKGPFRRLAKATTARELLAWWEEWPQDDTNTPIPNEMLVMAPRFVNTTWAIMRRLFRETGVRKPPHKPEIMEPNDDTSGLLTRPFIRCQHAHWDGTPIPVNSLLLQNAVDDIIDWCREVEGLSTKRVRKMQFGDRGPGKKVPKQRWTQPDLDARIQAEITKCSDAIRAARSGAEGARKTVHELFGRNALAGRLGVKAAKMVSNSPAWQSLADEFGIRRKGVKMAARRPANIGMTFAEEVVAKDTTAKDVERRETLKIIDGAIADLRYKDTKRKAKIVQALNATKDRLIGGEIEDTAARRIAEFTLSQAQDDASPKALGNM